MMLNSNSIGNKIATARKKANLSQAELAQQVSISPQAVGKWERGESMPDITTLNRLAEILGVDLNYFSDNFKPTEIKEINKEQQEKTTEPSPVSENKRLGLKWDMSKGNWTDADFSGLSNLQDKFNSSNLKNCKFIGSDLSGLLLNNNNVEKCDFTNSELRNCKIKSSNIENNLFDKCSLIDAEFYKSNIEKSSFVGSDFSGAEIISTNFESNKVEDAIWKLTTFKLSHIYNSIFNGLIEDCSFDNCSFSKVVFENAKIINTFFKGGKLKGIKFIDCQADRLTYEFLKNGKADLTGLTLIA